LTSVSKRVTFYDTVVDVTDDSGVETTQPVAPNFWPTLMDKLDERKHTGRIQTIGARRYYGQVVLPTRPAIRHLQVGRLRDLSEHLEQTHVLSGVVGPLELRDPNLRVSEPTFVVPFGQGGRVAMISPGRSTRQETIGHWLTAVLTLLPKGKSIRFVPVIDTDMLAKVISAQGAVGVEFNFDSAMSLAGSNSAILKSVEAVRTMGPNTGTVTISWSLGRDGGSHQDRNLLQSAAEAIIKMNLARRATANLVMTDDDENLRRETHDLIADKVVKTIRYKVGADDSQTTETILVAVNDAISEVRGRSASDSATSGGIQADDGGNA